MSIKRYVIIQAVKTKENQLIPIWDERIVLEEDNIFGSYLLLKEDYKHSILNLVECIYDLKTKKIEIGVELNYYPNEEDLEFKKDEIVFFEKSHRILSEAKITKIVYEEYEMEVKKGSELDKYWVEIFKDVKIDNDTLYTIKHWNPFYILNNGIKIKYSHQLYHKSK